MSRSRRPNWKGLPRCSCGHTQPCPGMDPLGDMHQQIQRKHNDRRHDVRHPIEEDE